MILHCCFPASEICKKTSKTSRIAGKNHGFCLRLSFGYQSIDSLWPIVQDVDDLTGGAAMFSQLPLVILQTMPFIDDYDSWFIYIYICIHSEMLWCLFVLNVCANFIKHIHINTLPLWLGLTFVALSASKTEQLYIEFYRRTCLSVDAIFPQKENQQKSLLPPRQVMRTLRNSIQLSIL